MKTVSLCLALVIVGIQEGRSQQVDELQIAPAIELKFRNEEHSISALLASDNLQDWVEVSQDFRAAEEERSVFFPAGEKAKFYRMETYPVDDLGAMLEPIRSARGLPGLSAVVVVSNRIAGIGAVGVRKMGTSEPVTIEDKWHIGSCTKSMTATLAAMLVEEGKIEWSSTLGEIFPEYSGLMHPSWRDVTLELLLSNRSGAPGTMETGLWNTLWNFAGSPREARLHLLTNTVNSVPEATPGTTYIYSNTGFSIAGAMLEKVADRAWEELMEKRLFAPLGMTSSGFGVPATPRYLDQPWGHNLQQGTVTSIQPGIAADNPPAIGPGGCVHASLTDLAKYVSFHIAGGKGPTPLLASFEKLHTPAPGESYALGWEVASRDWTGGEALTHTGSNLQWFTIIWIAPEREFALVVNTNYGETSAFNALDAVIWELIQKYL